MPDTYITIASLFILGLCVGSFLNVCIYRMPPRISVLNPRRSFCPKCKRQLTWKENIPVLSWLMQGTKCRGCQEPISGQYPLVEILGGFAAVASYLRFGMTPTFIIVLLLLWVLIVVTFIDLEHWIIPDRITKPGTAIGLALGVISQYTGIFACSRLQQHCPITQDILDSVLGSVIGAGFFFVIAWAYERLRKQSGLGFGDVKFMMMTGAILGVESVAPIIVLGSASGALIGIAVMLITKDGLKTRIPFGPFLALGVTLYLFSDSAIEFFAALGRGSH